MKRISILLFGALLFAQCSENIPEEATETAVEAVIITDGVQLHSEELKPYALTVIDSVYSISVKISSQESAVVQYNATLIQGNQEFRDSLILPIDAGATVVGELIFPACRVQNQPKVSLTSTIKRLNDR